ncbi:MAG: RNA polymerase sigma factor [Blastocatellia bacterium]
MRAKVILFKESLAVPDRAEQTLDLTVSQMKRLSDEDLMERLKQGDQDALGPLFDRYYRLVLSVALRILRDPGEAEDLMQEVFLEIYRKAGAFDPRKGSAKAWLLQYAYHRSLSRRQYLNVRRYYDQREITELEAAEPCYSLNGGDGLTDQERARVINQGLATLNEKQRRTLELACFQGLLLSEIAERMKESLPNVRHHYYRGLKKLRAFLRDQPGAARNPARSRQETSDVQS